MTRSSVRASRDPGGAFVVVRCYKGAGARPAVPSALRLSVASSPPQTCPAWRGSSPGIRRRLGSGASNNDA